MAVSAIAPITTMSKKILVIAASPRKGGNSDTLCDAFIRGARETGHTAEKIYVQDINPGACRACYACRKTGTCIQKDGMAEAIQKMAEADVLVLSTPVYFYSMSGQLKVFIDRILPGYTSIRNKDCYFIVTAADGNEMLERTMDALTGFTDCLPGAKVKGKIYGGGFYEPGTIAGSDAERAAYEAGKNA